MNAFEPFFGTGFHLSYWRTVSIRDGEQQVGLLLIVFQAYAVGRRIIDGLSFFDFLLLCGLPLFLDRQHIVFKIIGEHRSELRIGGRVEALAQKSFERMPVVLHFEVLQSLPDRKEQGRLFQVFGAEPSQGTVIVKDVEATPEGRQHQIAFPLLYGDIAHGDGRKSAFELCPFRTTVYTEVNPELRTYEEQVLVHVIFRHGVRTSADRQVGSDRGPCFSAIAAFEEIGPEVAVAVMVEGGVKDIPVVARSNNLIDVGTLRYSGYIVDA